MYQALWGRQPHLMADELPLCWTSGVKIGDLEREFQVWRERGDPRKGFSSGPDSWIWCTRCGDVLPTDPWEPRSCACRNIHQDYGRFDVEDYDEFVILATASLPSVPD